jgi:hypothetical protein
MNEKYSLKIIQHGKTQQARLVQSGAGMAGQAVVIQATDAARYQLVNVVTLVSPNKLQLKRVGDALHLVLPGGDIEAPDLVIQDYFQVKGASLQGSSISGEWMNYDTTGLTTNPAPSVSGADTLSSSVIDKTSNVSLGGEGVLGTFTEHPWLWAGGLAGAAAAGGGGGGGGSTPASDTSPLAVIQAYANATAGSGVTAPTLATYKSAGVKALANLSETTASADIDSATVTTALGVTSSAWLATLNSAVDKRTDGSTLTVAQLQALSDSYYRILSEADGSVNTSTDTIVYPSTGISNPTATDYANIGATVGNAKSVDLLNDFVGLSIKAAVDTVDEINTFAAAAYNVMLKAGVAVGTGSLPATYTLDTEWITGLTALGIVGVNANNIVAVNAAIAATAISGTANDGLEVDTVLEIKGLVKGAIALQAMVDYTNTNGTSTAPTLSTYTDAGIKAFNSLPYTSAADRVALSSSNADINALNSALDKLTGSSLTLNTSNTLFDGTVQKMVDSYYRILKEADGKYIGDTNGGAIYYDGTSVAKTADTDVYADVANDPSGAGSDPLASDYANIGLTKADGTALTVASPTNTKILALLNNAVGRFNTSKVDTLIELAAIEKAAENVFALSTGGLLGTVSYTGSTADADWVAGLTALGIAGVTASNITAIKLAIDAKDSANNGVAVDTVAELQAIVSLARMVAFTNDTAILGSKIAATPTMTDWGALVNVNTSLSDSTVINLDASTYWKSNSTNGVNALNSALDTYVGSTLTTTDLKNIADAYGRVLQEADNSRTFNTDVSKVDGSVNSDLLLADLTHLGVTFLNTPAITTGTTSLVSEEKLVLDVIAGMTSAAVDTVAELNDIAKAADNVVKQASGGTVSYLDSEWVSALSSLSISGVNTGNILDIKTAIAATADDGSGVDSYSELQGIVSLVRVNAYASLNPAGYSVPTIEDYQALVASHGVTADNTQYGNLTLNATTNAGGAVLAYGNANSSYLSSYNDAVYSKPSGVFLGIDVKNLVLAYNSILAEANGTASDQTTYDPLGTDYLAVGVGSGTSIDTNITTMLNVTEYATLLTDVIANKTTTQVDQVSELNALASIIVKIQDLQSKTAHGGANYTAITGGALQVSELASLGLDTSNLTNSAYSGSVLVNRLNNVYDNIIDITDGSSVSRATLDSLAEMQALINNTSGIVI